MTMGEKILALRKARGWSQEELAEQVGVTRQAVSRWESGAAKPDADKTIAVCDLFGVSADYLLRDNYSAEGPGAGQSEPVPSAAGGMRRLYRWVLVLGFLAGGIDLVLIRFMGLIRADKMSFRVFLRAEGLDTWYWLGGFVMVFFGGLLAVEAVRYFYRALTAERE